MLTDLEICKRIAEICDLPTPIQASNGPWIIAANPLTDDALCFQLMVKSEINVNFVECPAGTGKAYYATGRRFSDRNTICSDYMPTPNKAICLAIIEAHNE